MSFYKDFISKRRQSKELAMIVNLFQAHVNELMVRQNKEENDLLDVSVFLVSEILDAYKSFQILYKKDQMVSCAILARKILEIAVNLQYIYKEDCEKRARNYMLFSAKQFLKRFKKIEDDFEGKSEMISKMENIVKKYDPEGNYGGHWDGNTIKYIFDGINAGKVYEELYVRLSGFTHAMYKSNRDLNSERPYNDYLKTIIFRHIFVATLESLKMINEKFDLLEGSVVFLGYPKDEAILFFSINNKAMERDKDKIDDLLKKK